MVTARKFEVLLTDFETITLLVNEGQFPTREMTLPLLRTNAAHAHKLEGARKHGKIRRRQGYTVVNLAEESRILRRTVFLILQRNLLDLDFSQLFPDLVAMTDSLEAQLKESLVAYSDAEKAA